MGVQILQDFIDASNLFTKQFNKLLDENLFGDCSNLLVVHADSCWRYFYQENIDWVCGGQWSELFQNVDKFVRAFRQADIELVVFFDGTLNENSLHQWSTKHRFIRETVKEILSHVIHNQNYSFKTITKKFVAPGSFKTALRLAFRSCEVVVCSAVHDVYKECILYSKDTNSLGVLANDGNFFVYKAPKYLSLGNTKWLKKSLNGCKFYDTNKILEYFNLKDEHLAYLAALLGNFLISESSLASFYWDLIEEDNPLKKIQANVIGESLLPPGETRLKNIVKFLHANNENLKDIDAIGRLIFAKSSISVEEGSTKLKKIIAFYQDCLSASLSSCIPHVTIGNDLFTKAGFPLPIEGTNCSSRFKKLWKVPDKQKLEPENHVTTNNNENSLNDTEHVLKQGTLEEAAQALELLELNETKVNIEFEESSNKQPVVTNKCKDATEMFQPSENNVKSTILHYPRDITVTRLHESINIDVLNVALTRHQNGQMCPEILQLLTKGEIILDMGVDDELSTSRLAIPLLYRPLRQLVYGILFGVKQIEDHEKSLENKAENSDNEVRLSSFTVKEWSVYGDKPLDKPDEVEAKGMNWKIPPLRKLWLGTDVEDNSNRLKAFLSCMRSDTVNMSNTSMVPQRLIILCCVLRYLVQQEKVVLTKHDIDAFLAQSLSSHLTIDHNVQHLATIRLNVIDARCIQLAAIFMKGVEDAVLANDACGSPLPWELCCPWNFFDGKLFHSKWLQATTNANVLELCDGKPHLVEKLDRLRWCVTEGLHSKYLIAGFRNDSPFLNLYPLSVGPLYDVSQSQSYMQRIRSRGPGSKRPVHGSGATLHVAGFPVAHWDGNKSGIGYSKHGPKVLVGGPNCVDLPSSHRQRASPRRSMRAHLGRGLLETPFITPWHSNYGFEDYNNSAFHLMKGVNKSTPDRSKISKVNQKRVYSSRTRHQNRGVNNENKSVAWLDNEDLSNDKIVSPIKVASKYDVSFGRGQWINSAI
ncbi:constitutive coactivator of PPAR-gamma-like protein 1 homolog isoform X3 [Hydra vulgaris]|uniref:Constitutive coactivator of PPAR-gamma-like protein 1 homolog isoform X3 n=1 Tax=Hydra vulgaris TaxID=6087 RepID=A0ABM4DGA1_HYDVU